ncbi:MAG: hypothetical protein R3E39_20730 [Anaerolineae bacterium]
MQTILVHMANIQWTTQALHLACALARSDQSRIILLRLIEVQHISYLGSDFANRPLTPREFSDIAEYSATAEDYGVEMSIAQIQCLSPLAAVVAAARVVNANIVFVHVPPSRVPFLRQYHLWQLKRQFAQAHQQFYTLDPAPQEVIRVPAVTPISQPQPQRPRAHGQRLPLDSYQP